MATEIINLIGTYLSGVFIGLFIGIPTGYDKRYFEEKENNLGDIKDMNNIIELPINIDYCPYCGSNDIERDKEEDSCNCNECGRDFTIMTHE